MEGRIALSNKALATVGLVAAYVFVAVLCGLPRVNAAETSNVTCTRKSQMTTCVCSTASGVDEEASDSTDTATLSELSNGIAIQCPKATFDFVPAAETDVCVAATTAETLKSCKTNSKIPIKQFLNLKTDDNIPKWTETTVQSNEQHSIVFPEHIFPLVDKSFFVGCRQTSPDNGSAKQCVVNVSVKARTSAVKNGVLICAYGNESNESVPEVTLNSQNNSLTILCGSEGQMEPTKESLTAYHCAGSDTLDCKEVNLTEIMPTFTSSWWTTDSNNGNAPKLVIPEDGFPAQEETIVLGCNPDIAGTSKAPAGDQTAAAALPTCKVKMTLSPQTSGSLTTNASFHRLFVLVSIPLFFLGTY
ncbi:srs domain-containing protein [Neospora caninum Liverpool]|uniref:Srs domain-containing protein n=1 Tax=Neospora caninum (strain Liverpool) TaxID=572307 RepID=F0VAQ8_NEOCL|nr:srs domain-containing protein [Neospora caninum Liverpool]CBZ51316.1 srs domain-containing protein [Neospora caninum Liverpool]CEL68631.1 TPA: SRS domain-containing protein [Neospora caninum Liverpool]|eukprot:XP_003881349.1 srs domain-containing protein [Neospora caninum Liverpool]